MLIVLLTACLRGPSTDVLPDDRLLIHLPEQSTTTAKSLAKAGEKNWAQYYILTAQVTESVNGMTGWVLGLTNTIVTTQRPSSYDRETEHAEWGPYAQTLDPVETVLWVTHNEDDSYSWGYDQWPKEDESGRATVVTGTVDPGATHEENTGRFTIDFTTIHTMDPTSAISGGSFTADYTLTPDGATNSVTVADFGDVTVDGTYDYTTSSAGDGTMDLTALYNAYPGDQDESHHILSQWNSEGAGRADASLSGGDLGGKTGNAAECWDTAFERVYYTEDWSSTVEGDAGKCMIP